MPALKMDESYTYGDYLTWDDGERWELIRGVPYNMSPAPSTNHQRVLGELYLIFRNFFKGKGCEVFFAPFDVRLPVTDESDDMINTVVQPDLVIICDEKKIDRRGCRGAPDLIVEILSPSTAKMDIKVKLSLYEGHGVKEYWVVYPFEQVVELFKLGSDGKYLFPERYAGGDVISVEHFSGLEVDLNSVFRG